MRRQVVAFTFLLATASVLSADEIMQVTNSSPMESFKRFLDSPPIIESLVWQPDGSESELMALPESLTREKPSK